MLDQAGAAFNQLPPLPTIGGAGAAKRAVPTAPAVSAKPFPGAFKEEPPPQKPRGSPRQADETPAKPGARSAPAAPAAPAALALALGKGGGGAKGVRTANKPSARGAAGPARPTPVEVTNNSPVRVVE